jgi:hypothetical protein
MILFAATKLLMLDLIVKNAFDFTCYKFGPSFEPLFVTIIIAFLF